MNWAKAQSMMAALAERFDIAGCALVEPESGWVWHSCGPTADASEVWETAVEYWRLHDRLPDGAGALGDLAAMVLYHRRGALAILPCSARPRLHMVCLSKGSMDWIAWQRGVRDVARQLEFADAVT